MRFSFLAVTGLASLVAAKSAVLDLIPSNFDDVVLKSGKPTLVEFFAPWCGHCKNLAPVYEDLAQVFASSDAVQIAKVDADAEKSLGKRFGVQGFPTLKFFDGKSKDPVDYKGGRDLDSLTSFITEKTGVKARKKAAPVSSVVMLTESTFAQTTADNDVLVAFTAPWCGHCKNLAPTWEKVAADFASDAGVVIAKVDAEAENAKQLAKDQGVTSYPTIKFFRKGSSSTPELYEGERSEKAFVEFVNSKTGTHRTPGGGLDATAGTISELDTLVAKFAAGRATLAEAAQEAKKAANVLQGQLGTKFAEYYVRVFDKLSQNEAYVAKELARLEGILGKGGLVATKADELTSKTNILRKFLEKPAEKADDEKEEL